MRLTIPRLRVWHLLGVVAACAAFVSVMQFRWSVEDPGYDRIRRLRSLDAAERERAAGDLALSRPVDRRAIGPLTEMLFDPDFRARAMAARALVRAVPTDDPEAGRLRAVLTSALADANPVARRSVAVALASLEPEPGVVVPVLMESIRDPSAEVRGEVVNWLGIFAHRDSAARDALLAALRDPAFEVRLQAADRLGASVLLPRLAPQPVMKSAVEALRHAADDKSALVRAASIRGLARIAAETKVDIPRTIEALGDPDADVRIAAVVFLIWSGPGKRSPMLSPALARVLGDPDPRVRANAARALGYLGLDAEAALPALRPLAGDPEREVRVRAEEAIARIDRAIRTFRSTTLPQTIADLTSNDPATREVAAGRAGDLESRAADAVPALARCLSDREAGVRRAAARSLGQIGPAASVALPDLERLAESDPDEPVRRAASFACATLTRAAPDRAPGP